MKKSAFLFPGQGSQEVGMGLDLYNEFGFAREIFEMADETAQTRISKLCFTGPMEDLTLTVNLQPAVTAVNLAFIAVLEKEGIRPDFSAGHSLGEYCALRTAGIFSTEETLRIVQKRGELMHREATRHKGTMQAILGVSIDAVQEAVAEVRKDGGIVSVGNHNTEQQIVLTGAQEPVEKAAALLQSRGAKAIPLRVSGAWHSDLMKGAVPEFKAFLDQTEFRAPALPVVFNVTADTEKNTEEIRSIMGRQLCSPVRWYESMRRLVDEGVETFAEIGPGRVLSGMLKKILPRDYPGKVYTVNTLRSLEAFLKETA